MKKSIFLENIKEHQNLIEQLKELNDEVLKVGAIAGNCLRLGGRVFFCGNGGSAADSQHLAAELTGRFIRDRRPLSAIALSTDTSALTCIANDYSFDEVFSRQIQGLGRSGDLLIGISTSGNSRNVIRAIEAAQKLNIRTVGLLGRDGGLLRDLCENSIVIPSLSTARIQECHILVGHTLCGLIEHELGLL